MRFTQEKRAARYVQTNLVERWHGPTTVGDLAIRLKATPAASAR